MHSNSLYHHLHLQTSICRTIYNRLHLAHLLSESRLASWLGHRSSQQLRWDRVNVLTPGPNARTPLHPGFLTYNYHIQYFLHNTFTYSYIFFARFAVCTALNVYCAHLIRISAHFYVPIHSSTRSSSFFTYTNIYSFFVCASHSFMCYDSFHVLHLHYIWYTFLWKTFNYLLVKIYHIPAETYAFYSS